MNQNTGHGHVFPRPDGVRARCGGPGMCAECSRDLARQHAGERQQSVVSLVEGFPRRNRADLWTPAEKAISDAVAVVEAAGAHTRLTDAVVLLGKARDAVADYVDEQLTAPK